MPASTQTALSWAPLKSSVLLPSSSKLTSGWTFIFLEWICRILALASWLGWGNSIFLSSLPLLIRAGSRMSALFVAAMTLISSWELNPSSWFRSSSIVRCTSLSPLSSESKRLVPIASISSMNMIQGDFSLASAKASRTSLAPSPMNICTSWGPASFKKVAFVCAAHALAISVLPVPGGPYSSTPFGGRIPKFSKCFLCVMGSTMASTSSRICLSRPPMSE
mmetsp:Transcript_22998/g.48708  ORF Transcript_22998/g.48708 Transcript_22998/m.48708 type:complete len:221 (-) Transcript_22998:835-1497(-)